ncbi:MAG: pyruvate dehydrogenase (acetyl-transferring) E1 component subunit alpha [Chloroflexi bacterium]|nr:pyruvate dehydrogenase (acetyl-transferring) E1 component subunit alpha [Chloroflexota bacterium]
MELRTTLSVEDKKVLQSNKEETRRLYYLMLLVRRFEEKVAEMYTRAKIGGFVHLNIGEEATVVGSVSALADLDYVFTSYREHGYILSRGTDPKYVMAELFGKETGVSKGRGGSMHLFDRERHFMGGYAIVGGQLPLAVGTGLASLYRGEDAATLCVFGDGATNIGAFHESLNLAKVWNLPVVFLCVNNQYGMGTAVTRASAVKDIYKKALAYDMHSEQVNGMDVLAVRDAVAKALDRARQQHEPSFVESITYRYRGHSMSDPGKYRSDEEVKAWRERDPIGNFQHRLLEAGVLSDADVQAVEDEVDQVVQEAVDYADQSPAPDPNDLYENVYVGEEGK